MCKHYRKYMDFMWEFKQQRASLVNELSHFDKVISKLYHELEKVEPSEEFALSFVTQLHDALKKRRVIKQELLRVDAVLRPLLDTAEEVEKSVLRGRKTASRWRRDFKIKLTVNDVITKSCTVFEEISIETNQS